jgi:hypothetical protein
MNVPVFYNTGFFISDEVKDKISTLLNEHSEKYLHGCSDCHITIKQDSDIVQVDLRLSYEKHNGIIIRTNSSVRLHDDYQISVMSAFADALHKADGQMRKYKSKILDARKVQKDDEFILADKYVFDYSEYEEDEEFTIPQPAIIRENSSKIKTMSTQQAIVELDITGLPTIVFIEENTKRFAVVYNRKDGDISLLILPTK